MAQDSKEATEAGAGAAAQLCWAWGGDKGAARERLAGAKAGRPPLPPHFLLSQPLLLLLLFHLFLPVGALFYFIFHEF